MELKSTHNIATKCENKSKKIYLTNFQKSLLLVEKKLLPNRN